jgi:exosome complex component RRP45
MIVTMNRHGEVCQLAKLGGVPVDAMLLLNCTTVALTKVKEITELISKKLQADATNRDVGGLIAELSAENER